MVKNITLLLLTFLCISCDLFEPEKEPDKVSFNFENSDNTVFRELKVIAYEVENEQSIAYDSVYHYPLKSPGIPFNSSAEIAFLDQSFQYKQEGFFEAVAIKEDSKIFREQIGEIKGNQTRKRYNIELSRSGITLK